MEKFGADDTLTETFGYLASGPTSSIAAAMRALLGDLAGEAHVVDDQRAAPDDAPRSRAKLAMLPGAKNIIGMPAFSAAGKTQSACSQHRGLLALEGQPDALHAGLLLPFGQQRLGFGFSSGMRPMTAKRLG